MPSNAPKPGPANKGHRVVVKDGITRILDAKPVKPVVEKPVVPQFKYKRRDHLYQKPFQSLAEYLEGTA